MIIKHLGHSCFFFQSDDGTRILADPCDPETGYTIGPVAVDAVTCSHGHHDHSYAKAASNSDAAVITDLKRHNVKGAVIEGFSTFHDDVMGKRRGKNVMFLYELDGLRILHAGDIGHIPDPETMSDIGHIDVLFVPVGGIYTVDYKDALKIVELLDPSVVIPMHYKDPKLAFDLGPLQPFLDNAEGYEVTLSESGQISLSKDDIPRKRISVLKCAL